MPFAVAIWAFACDSGTVSGPAELSRHLLPQGREGVLVRPPFPLSTPNKKISCCKVFLGLSCATKRTSKQGECAASFQVLGCSPGSGQGRQGIRCAPEFRYSELPSLGIPSPNGWLRTAGSFILTTGPDDRRSRRQHVARKLFCIALPGPRGWKHFQPAYLGNTQLGRVTPPMGTPTGAEDVFDD
jgi:hypothetical protein